MNAIRSGLGRALLAAALCACTVLPSQASSVEQAFEEALQQYQDNHWAAAYERLAALADRGHAESARIALLMLRHGRTLYGNTRTATPVQIERWTTLASRPEATAQVAGGSR